MKKLTLIPLTAVALLFSTAAHSTSGNLFTWIGIYPDSTSDDNASCQLCHGASTRDLNAYGAALCASTAGTITNRIRDVEKLNSDSDPTGADNLVEITASTQPGWTPGNVNPTYSRTTCKPTGLVESPPATILGSLDPAAGNVPPVADANGPYSGTVNVPLGFDGSASSDSDGTIVAYDWDFGDGSTGTGVKPTHTYVSGGTFTVFLTVTDDAGATGKASATATIGLGNLPPIANVNGPYTGTTGTAITFDGSASKDPDGTISAYSWDFGDGTTGTGAKPSHTYTSANIYNVILTVMDDAGATNSASTTATITDSQVNQPPVAVPNGPYSGTVGTPVKFDGSASNDPDGSIASYSWDFGDGTSGSGSTPLHTYQSSGRYTVILTVTDDQGATGSMGTSADIKPATGGDDDEDDDEEEEDDDHHDEDDNGDDEHEDEEHDDS